MSHPLICDVIPMYSYVENAMENIVEMTVRAPRMYIFFLFYWFSSMEVVAILEYKRSSECNISANVNPSHTFNGAGVHRSDITD